MMIGVCIGKVDFSFSFSFSCTYITYMYMYVYMVELVIKCTHPASNHSVTTRDKA